MPQMAVSIRQQEKISAHGAPRRPVYLYCAISRAEEFRPVRRTPQQQVRLNLRRLTDDVMWRGLGRWQYEFWRYQDHRFTNIGDIAIREACVELVRRALPDVAEIRTLNWDRLDDEVIEEVNHNASAFIVAGSGYFIFDESWKLGRRVGTDLPFLSALRVPKIMMGVGVNNPSVRQLPSGPVSVDARGAALLREMFSTFDLVSVRDQLSKDVLQPFALNDIMLLPDPALFLASLRGERASSRRDPAGPLHVGLNLALHGPRSEKLLLDNLPTLAAAFRDFQKESGCRYSYFIHSEGEWKAADLLARAGVHLDVVSGGPDELIARYRDLSFHVGQMLHSSILAMSTDCPAIGLAYDVKSLSFFRLMGLDRYCVSADGIAGAKVIEMMRGITGERQALRQQLAGRREQLFAAMGDGLARVTAAVQTASD
jgi:polysaccharide pyruvyl transferase WcaK-like protein